MSTVEQTRDRLHPSLRPQFEDIVFSIADEWAVPVAWRKSGPYYLDIHSARREVANEIFDMDIDELIDLADPDKGGMLEDLIQ